MKKLTALFMAIAMSLSLVACGGGPDKQPAIDAMDKAGAAFNEVANKMNENIGIYPQETVDELNELADLMNEKVELLSSDTKLTQEDIDAIIAASAEIEAWAVEIKPMLDTLVDTQPANEAFTSAANAYNEVATYMNENVDLFTQEDIDAMTEVGELLMECKETLESITFTDQESLDAFIASLADIESWAVSVKEALGI